MAASSDLKVLADESTVIAPADAEQSINELDRPTDILKDYTFPIPQFAKARSWPTADGTERRLPQIIAHRGYKSRFPENSLLAFEEAIKAGATALETDVRLTKDEVVVLEHHGDLKRFGHGKKITDCTWDEIKDFRTVDPPHAPICRLQELLEFLRQSENANIWVLLDIKLAGRAEDVIRVLKSTIDTAQAPPGRPWNRRILMGTWAARQIPLVAKHLPGYSTIHIGYHLGHAKQNVQALYMGVALMIYTALAPSSRRFIEDRKTKGPVIAWPVSETDQIEWCARSGLDGVITDDPEAMAKLWERFDVGATRPILPVSVRSCLWTLFYYFWVNSMFWLFRKVTHLDRDEEGTKESVDKKKEA
ncbi:hypothetical protein PRZ48_012598 [Zasmidium cellare]|uniref:GP-PDE domain-containing protein n=1 Tax=Zasmidium cellare TaxID=395010 RepID=A0ABR0E693_ZASCE|nr:hypothetical protein PRZ48_012598 [Zasmidium cellare]